MILTPILVPVDFSPHATLALAEAVELATPYQASSPWCMSSRR